MVIRDGLTVYPGLPVDQWPPGPYDTCPDPADETEFRTALTRMLRWYGWRVHFNQPARPGRRAGRAYMTMGSPGFPDLLALRPPDLALLECKMVGGVTSPEQRLWINGFAAVEGNVGAWVVDVGAWPHLVRLARGGIAAVEAGSADEQEEEHDGERSR